jgi:hypothetical protein
VSSCAQRAAAEGEPEAKVGVLGRAAAIGGLCVLAGGLIGGAIGYARADTSGGTVTALPARDAIGSTPGPSFTVPIPAHIDPIDNITGTGSFGNVPQCNLPAIANQRVVIDIRPPRMRMDIQGFLPFAGTISGVDYKLAIPQNLLTASGTFVKGTQQGITLTFNTSQCRNGQSSGTINLAQPLVIVDSAPGLPTEALFTNPIRLSSGTTARAESRRFWGWPLGLGLGAGLVGVGVSGWGWRLKRRRLLDSVAADDDDLHASPVTPAYQAGVGK